MSPPLLRNIRVSTSNQGFNVSRSRYAISCFYSNFKLTQKSEVAVILGYLKMNNSVNTKKEEKKCKEMRDNFMSSMSALAGRLCEIRILVGDKIVKKHNGCGINWSKFVKEHLGRAPKPQRKELKYHQLLDLEEKLESKLEEA